MTDLSHIAHLDRVIAAAAADADPQETAEWIAALVSVIEGSGAERGRFLLDALQRHAARAGLNWKPG